MPSVPLTTRRLALASVAGLGLVATPLTIITPAAQAAPVTITVVGTNDFHGRLTTLTGPGAAKYAGAVDSLRAANPNTIFAAAGDLIGASEFESFINNDKPAIDVLNAMGLDVSAVGNHELDQGYDDLVNRVMAPESAANPDGGAGWQYVAANLDEPGDADLIPPSHVEEIAGVTVGFVGSVTEDLPSLVSPDGIQGVTVEDIVEATNREAEALTAAGADVVVMLVHEGAPSTDCATMADPATTWGNIVTNVNANVDAIISGHTHLPYDCEFPVAGSALPRPVVSAGQYGSHLDKLDFTVEPTTGEILGIDHELVDVTNGTFEPNAEVAAIVDQAIADAEGPGSVVLGQVQAALKRAVQPDSTPEDGPSENRGGESTIGNLVAEVQRWNTRTAERGGAQIAFMNPGGVRNNIDAGEVTYKEAAVVQPFANTLVNMDMTGAQIKTLLEQQWQRDAQGNVPSRPFLRLGTSRGFEYTYNPDRAEGDRITGIWLKGKPIDPAATYSVTANSFLAAGGDNFRVFREATNKRDTGVVDLEGMVDYLAAKASGDAPLAVDYAQHAVGVDKLARKVARGGTIGFELSSLAMTADGDVQEKVIRIRLAGKTIGKAPVDNTLLAGGFDETGTALVEATIPDDAKLGRQYVVIVGKRTGTSIKMPVRITRQ